MFNIEDIVNFASKVLYVILKNEISIDKAFQRVKQRWRDRESFKIYYDVVFRIVQEYFKLEYISRRIFGSVSCKNIVRTWLLLEGADYFRNRNMVLPYLRKQLKKTKLREIEKLREKINEIMEDLRHRDPVEYICVKYSYPRPYVEKLLEVLSLDEIEKILYSLNSYTTWIRINTLKIDVDKCVKLLEKQGLEVEIDRDVPFLVKVLSAKRPVHHVEAIKRGLAVIQDKASVLTVLVLSPEPGETILDLCAAPGMKTSLIMQLTDNRARVIAADISSNRLRSMKHILKHLGADIDKIDIVLTDSRILKTRPSLRPDKLLIDAPCTSSGAAGKDPAIKIALRTLRRLSWYTDIQKRLLENAANNYTETTVVYTTCSLFPDEGEEIIKYILERYNNITLERPSTPPLLPAYQKYKEVGQRTVRTYPHKHCCEGFYIARLYISKN